MKKKLLLLTACAALLFSGCSAGNVARTVKNASKSLSTINETVQTTASPAPTAAPSSKETKLKLGKKGTVDDWKICVKKVAATKKINDGDYRYFSPDKGNSYVCFTVSVRNNGKKGTEFMPRFGYADKLINATLYYKEDYEYHPTELISYDKDLIGKNIQPLTTKKGIITFEVPKKVAKNKKNLTLKIGTATEQLIYTINK